MATPYRSLPVEKRTELVTHDIKANSGSRGAYILAMMKKGGGFRQTTLRKWPVEQLAREVVRRRLETLQDEIGYLQLLYVELEPELQISFLSRVGVQHEDGVISEELEPPLATEQEVTSAAALTVEEFGDRGRHYLLTIATYNPEAWPGLGEWLAEQEESA